MVARLHERTQVVVPLGYVAGAVVALILSTGAYIHEIEKEVARVGTDVAVLRATLIPKTGAAYGFEDQPRPEFPPLPPVTVPDPAFANRGRDGFHR
jgi:hypothetical protein